MRTWLVLVATRFWIRRRDPNAARHAVQSLASRLNVASKPNQVKRSIRRAGRFVPGATCLVRAIAAEGILRASDQPVQLFVGIRKHRRELQAHAWLQSGDVTLFAESRDNNFHGVEIP